MQIENFTPDQFVNSDEYNNIVNSIVNGQVAPDECQALIELQEKHIHGDVEAGRVLLELNSKTPIIPLNYESGTKVPTAWQTLDIDKCLPGEIVSFITDPYIEKQQKQPRTLLYNSDRHLNALKAHSNYFNKANYVAETFAESGLIGGHIFFHDPLLEPNYPPHLLNTIKKIHLRYNTEDLRLHELKKIFSDLIVRVPSTVLSNRVDLEVYDSKLKYIREYAFIRQEGKDWQAHIIKGINARNAELSAKK